VRVPDAAIDEVRERGFSVIDEFLAPDELKAAQQALWLHFPTPEDYFTDVHLPLRRHRARRPDSDRSLRARQGRSVHSALPGMDMTPYRQTNFVTPIGSAEVRVSRTGKAAET
jgi:hypothetical protein